MNTIVQLGNLTSVGLNQIWPGEATHFTPWLAQNLDQLGKALGMDLELESTEVSAGDFSADIVALDLSTNHRVVIENQFGVTDHRHLGQLLTYCANLDAQSVVWIAESFRSEHKAAMDFLNLHLSNRLSLYAIEAAAIRIDQSRPAFTLSVVSRPNESRVLGAGPSSLSETQFKYRSFFQGLIDELRVKHSFTNARLGQPQNWYSFASENSKFYKYGASFASGSRVRVDIYIDSGEKVRNESLFDELQANKIEINAAMGCQLEWEKLDAKRACRVAMYRDGDIDVDSAELSNIQNWVVAALLKFKQVLPPYITRSLQRISAASQE